MEIQGKIIVDLPLQEGTSKAGNPWKKKEYVLETVNTSYPRKVKFDFFGDRADTYRLEVGKVYSLTYDIESREFNGRWYTDIRGISAVEVPQGGATQPGPQGGFPQPPQPTGFGQPTGFPQPPTADPFIAGGDDENLPF